MKATEKQWLRDDQTEECLQVVEHKEKGKWEDGGDLNRFYCDRVYSDKWSWQVTCISKHPIESSDQMVLSYSYPMA